MDEADRKFMRQVIKQLDCLETNGMSLKEWKENREKLKMMGMRIRIPVKIIDKRVWLKLRVPYLETSRGFFIVNSYCDLLNQFSSVSERFR